MKPLLRRPAFAALAAVLILLIHALPSSGLEKTSARVHEGMRHPGEWSRSQTCSITYYNYCTGWVWINSNYLPNDELGVSFDAEDCGALNPDRQLLWTYHYFWTGAPSGYGYTGSFSLYDDSDDNDCPDGNLIAAQPYLPVSGWNQVLWGNAVPPDFIVTYTKGPGGLFGPLPTFTFDHPAAGPTGPQALGTCYPSTRPTHSFHYGNASSPLCPGSPFFDGVGNQELLWSAAILWSPNVLDAVPAATCITPATPCNVVDFELARFEGTPMRGFSVTFTLSPELELCAGLGSITEGTYLSGIGGTQFQVLDNGGGSYTADCAILGTPCGAVGDGVLFSVEVTNSGADGTGTITIDSITTRDCVNGPIDTDPGDSASITIDNTAPGAVTGVAATQVKTGNDSDGTTAITVALTPPGDADLSSIEVYRAPYGAGDVVGAYPEYDDVGGAGPPAVPSYPPGPPWALTAVNASGQADEPPVRGYWYYVAFATDDCGNVSAASTVSGGTLNYHLGDVSDGATPGDGDNLVMTADMSLLGANYGAALGLPDPVGYLDVGPTSDFSVDGLPLTDQSVDFEDLILFAINFGVVSGPRAIPERPSSDVALLQPEVTLEVSRVGEEAVGRLSLSDNGNRVKGIHAFVSLEGLELVSLDSGSLVDAQAAPVFLETVEGTNGVWVDLALLGQGLALDGDGEFAVLTLSGSGSARLGDVVLRDRRNRPAGRAPAEVAPEEAPGRTDGPLGLPAQVSLVGARPNPFDSSTSIVFRLPSAAPVSVTVYDVTGRLVRTLVDRTVAAGETSVKWDGRADDGSLAGTGVYFYTFRSGDVQETRKILRMN